MPCVSEYRLQLARRRVHGLIALCTLLLGAAVSSHLFAQSPITFQYFYDDLNQLVKVVDSTGVVVEVSVRRRREHPTGQALNRLTRRAYDFQRDTADGGCGQYDHHPRTGIQPDGFAQYCHDRRRRRHRGFGDQHNDSCHGAGKCRQRSDYGPSGQREVTTSANESVLPIPIITSISPRTALAGTTISNFTVTGANLSATTFGFPFTRSAPARS